MLEEGSVQGEEGSVQAAEVEDGSMQGEDEEGSVQGDEVGSTQGGGGGGEGLVLEEAGSTQLVMATPTSFTSAEVACGEDDQTGMASILDLIADGLAYTLDRKANIEEALLLDLLASLRKEQQKLEAEAERLATSPS